MDHKFCLKTRSVRQTALFLKRNMTAWEEFIIFI